MKRVGNRINPIAIEKDPKTRWLKKGVA